MNLFVTCLFLFCLLTCVAGGSSYRSSGTRHNSALSPSVQYPAMFSHEFGARIRHNKQPEVIVASASDSFGTKTAKNPSSQSAASFSTTEKPETQSEPSKHDDSSGDNYSHENTEEEAFPENIVGEFSRQDSTSAAQNSMNDMVERMKMSTLRRAMQSIKKEEEDAEMNDHDHEQEHDGDNEQQFLEQESLDDSRRRRRKNNIITGQGDIQIAVKSRRKYEMMPVHFDRHNEQTPRMIEIVSDTMPLRLHFRSKSSAIVVSQSHDPTPMKAIEEKVTMDEPYRLAHEVHKPIIQEVREFIQPYRNVIQTLRPVIEDIRTVVPKDSDVAHQHKYRPTSKPGKHFHKRPENNHDDGATKLPSHSHNEDSKRFHRIPNSPGIKSSKNSREEQMTIPTMNYASWSHQKPILRPPPPRNGPPTRQTVNQATFLRSPANQISQRPVQHKINGNLNLEASEPEFVYAALTNGTENDLNSGQEYEKVETYSGESEKVSESREIEQVTESSLTQTEPKMEVNRNDRFVGIDSLSNRRSDKHAEDGAGQVKAAHILVHSSHQQLPDAHENRFKSIDSTVLSVAADTGAGPAPNNHNFNQHFSADLNKQLQQLQLQELHDKHLRSLHNEQLHPHHHPHHSHHHHHAHNELLKEHASYAFPFTNHAADETPFEPFILNEINFGTALERIEQHHHHVHHQHHHHLHHRIHHRLPFGI